MNSQPLLYNSQYEMMKLSREMGNTGYSATTMLIVFIVFAILAFGVAYFITGCTKEKCSKKCESECDDLKCP